MKEIAYLKWIGILLIKLIAWPYSLIVWPIAYVFRKKVRMSRYKWNSMFNPAWWLWITLDDENDAGEDWWIAIHKYKKTMWTAFKWSWARNNSWNLNKVLTIPFMDEIVVSGYDTSKLNDPLYHCRFKWEILDRYGAVVMDGWTVNQGDRLSRLYTNMGKAFCWYSDYHDPIRKPLWRASYAGIKWGWMINYKLGFNQRGEALIDLKIKKFHGYFTDHWD